MDGNDPAVISDPDFQLLLGGQVYYAPSVSPPGEFDICPGSSCRIPAPNQQHVHQLHIDDGFPHCGHRGLLRPPSLVTQGETATLKSGGLVSHRFREATAASRYRLTISHIHRATSRKPRRILDKLLVE